MPSILSRVRGLLAPTTLDQPLRLADGSGGGGSLLTTKGDLLGYDTGADRVPVGADGLVVTADSTAALGLSYKAASPLTTKGDIFTFGSAVARLAVGSNGDVLKADSTQTTGLKWDAASGSLTVTDGSTTLTSITELNCTSGITVSSGGAGIANLSASSGGGGGTANITPDTHPVTPDPADDEFEGGSLDTTGSRFSGANPWVWYNQAASTATLADGLVSLSLSGSGVLQGIYNAAPATPWSITTKLFIDTASSGLQGLFLYNSANTNGVVYGPWFAGPGNYGAVNFTAGSVIAAAFNSNAPGTQNTDRFIYFRIANDGTNLTFSFSALGYFYTTLATIALSAFIGAVTHFGLGGIGAITQHTDYFRRK